MGSNKRRSPGNTIHPYEIINYCQQLEAEGYVDEAIQEYLMFLNQYEPTSPNAVKPFAFPRRVDDLPDNPPESVLLSSIHTSVAGLLDDVKEHEESRKHFHKALRYWPTNSMALVNLGNLEREHGVFSACEKHFQQVCNLDLDVFDVDDEDSCSWVNQWVYDRYEKCKSVATYMTALHYQQDGEYEKAKPLLQRFRYQYRVAPNVWDALRNDPGASVDRSFKAGEEEDAPLRLFENAIPDPLLHALQRAFSADSSFWEQTDYAERSYYSFWYDTSLPPSNLVETLVQHLLPLTGRDDIVGAEWWVHSRSKGRNLGHQFHFDTEENTLETGGEIVHPVYGSVCYLSGAGASPTFVLDQTSDAVDVCEKGWLARPADAGFLLFEGDRLHGVLPKKPRTRAQDLNTQEGDNRLTLMIGFWNQNVVKNGKRRLLGPCGPIPHVTRSCTWPMELQPQPNELPKELHSDPKRLAVEALAPVWENIAVHEEEDQTKEEGHAEDSDGEDVDDVLDIPEEIDQHFFIQDVEVFRAHLVESCLSRGMQEG